MKIRHNRAKTPGAAPPPVQQAPPPPEIKRSKPNRWFIVVLLLLGLLLGWVWDHFLRTSAHAIVKVDEIQISAPLTGLIASMGVKEDGRYEAGTIAFTIVDRDARDELETLQLQLRLIESRMVEKSLNLKLGRADRLYEHDELIGQHRANLGKARFEQARLSADIAHLTATLPLKEFQFSKIEDLAMKDAASQQEWVAARSDYEAAANRLAELVAAQEAVISRIEALRCVIERPVPEAPDIDVSIEPLRREAQLVRRRIEQLHERLLQSEVRLSTSGRVDHIAHRPGEFVKAGDPILTLVSPGSIHVVAYFDQDDAASLQLNQEVRIVSSHAQDTTGRITRLGPHLRIGPEAIARFHARGTPVFPIEISVDNVARRQLIPGSVVRVFPLRRFSTVKKALAD